MNEVLRELFEDLASSLYGVEIVLETLGETVEQEKGKECEYELGTIWTCLDGLKESIGELRSKLYNG